MRKVAALCALLVAALPASCAFILDFDELQAGDDQDAGQGGSTATGGTAGSAGATSGCPGGCDDDDECTIDRCDTSLDPPACAYEPGGLVHDGFSYTTDADQIHRVTMIGGGGSFYLSLFTTDNGAQDVELLRFSDTDAGITQGPRFSEFALLVGNPESAAGLAIDQRAGFRIHAYAAIGGPTGGNVGQVFELVFSPDWSIQLTQSGRTAIAGNYALGNPRNYPITIKPEGSAPVHGAWIGPDGAIYAHQSGGGQSANMPSFNVGGTRAQVLAPLVAGDTPGVFWLTDRPHAQLLGGPPAQLPTCDAPTNLFPSAASSPAVFLAGGNFVSFTEVANEYIGTESVLVICGGGDKSCSVLGENDCSADNRVFPLVRNGDVRLFSRPGDPPGRVWQVYALPSIDPETDPPDGVMSLSVLRLDFDPVNIGEITGIASLTGDDPLELARMPVVGDEARGPDWAAAAISGGDRIAVAWIQPKGGADELHVERFRICE